MKYKIIGKRGDLPFEMSANEIDLCIKKHLFTEEIQWIDYLYDEAGNRCGLKGLADLGHGYGFHTEWEAFTLKMGETYSFSHEYTSIDGPSDWSDDSYKVELRLVPSED